MIRIGFSTSTGLVSRAIRAFTRAKVSHCFLIVDDSFFGVTLVMEAQRNGFVLVPFKGYAESHQVIAVMEPLFPLDTGVKLSAEWLGTRYDYLGVVGMALVIAGRWLGRKVRNPLVSSHAVFCSEVLARVAIASEYPGSGALDPDDVSPAELLAFFSAGAPAV